MWPFYAGITKLRSPDVLQYNYAGFDLTGLPVENSKCQDSIVIIGFSVSRIVIVLNSIYEAQLSSDFCKCEVATNSVLTCV